MDQHPTRVRDEAKRHRGDGMRWCQTRNECDANGITPSGSPQNIGDGYRMMPQSKAEWVDIGGLSTAGLKCREQEFIRRGYSVHRLQRSDDGYRMMPQFKAEWVDIGGLSTAGLKRREQEFIRRDYSVHRLQRSDGGPMGGPPLRKLQATVTSVARCDYGPPPLAGPKLQRQRPHTGLTRPWMVIRSRCELSLNGLVNKRQRRALGWTSTLPVCVMSRNDIEVTA